MNDDQLLEEIARAICLEDETCRGACYATAEDVLTVVKRHTSEITAAGEQDRQRIDRVIGLCAQVDPEKEPISAFFAACIVHALFPRKADA